MATITKMPPPTTVDEYIKRYPPKVQTQLRKVRQVIKKAAPQVQELVSYHMPAYKYQGMLVAFAAWKNHISLYPAPWGDEALRKEMSAYEGSKGTIKFPLDEPLPLSLIAKIVKYRVKKTKQSLHSKTN